MPFGPYPLQKLRHIVLPTGIEARSRLVDDKQIRLVQYGLCDSQSLEHPFRIRSDTPVGGIMNTDDLEYRVDTGMQRRAPQVGEFAQRCQVFPAGELCMVARALRKIADPPVDALNLARPKDPD